jgi:succinyl-diaminopimelate desuccinylase
VPTGPLDQWSSDPFTPTHRDGKLYGRGRGDMKTSLAAFVVAVEEFLAAQPDPRLSIAAADQRRGRPGHRRHRGGVQRPPGARRAPDYCIVGEPTSVQRTGDMIKNGRRGTMSGKLTVKGMQGHIAYPQLARNPIHQVAPALAELVATEWDRGNVLPAHQLAGQQHPWRHRRQQRHPGAVVIDFNFRFCTESTPEDLQQRVKAVLDAHGLDYDLAWTVGGLPFLTTPGELVGAVQAAIRAETGIETELSTTGGTSDGRFIAQICPQVIECGPPNATIHKIDEHLPVADIEPLKNIYRRTLDNLNAAL